MKKIDLDTLVQLPLKTYSKIDNENLSVAGEASRKPTWVPTGEGGYAPASEMYTANPGSYQPQKYTTGEGSM